MSRGNVRRISTRVNDDTERRAAYETWLQSGLVLPCTPYDAFCAGYVARQAKRCGVCGADGDGNLQAARQELRVDAELLVQALKACATQGRCLGVRVIGEAAPAGEVHTPIEEW